MFTCLSLISGHPQGLFLFLQPPQHRLVPSKAVPCFIVTVKCHLVKLSLSLFSRLPVRIVGAGLSSSGRLNSGRFRFSIISCHILLDQVVLGTIRYEQMCSIFITYLFDQMWAREDIRGWKVITLVWQISLASGFDISTF